MKASFPARSLLIAALLVGVVVAMFLDAQHSAVAMAIVLAPFPVDAQLQGISIAFRNKELIADELFPRVPVGSESFKYNSFPKGTFFNAPDNRVGRTSAPNRVELGFSQTSNSTEDYGLDDVVPIKDVREAAAQGLANPVNAAVEFLASLNANRRELRASTLAFDPAQYAANNKLALAGNDRWDQYTQAESNPLADIEDSLEAMIMRPNVAVIGSKAYSKLARHPVIVKAYNGTTGDSGKVPKQFLQDLFELQEIFVGRAFVNTAKPGQAAVLSRVWGNHMLLVYRDKTADTNRGMTFGVTAQRGTKITGQQEDKNVGLEGGVIVRDGEKVKELIVSADCGFLLQDVIS